MTDQHRYRVSYRALMEITVRADDEYEAEAKATAIAESLADDIMYGRGGQAYVSTDTQDAPIIELDDE